MRGLLHLWQVRGLRRLVFVRVLSAFGDGAFQGALAVLVLFSPERQTDPAEIAAGFAVLLLPYSIIGPFAGALLDRWSRRRVIVWANLIRCALVAIVAVQIAAKLPSIILFITALLIMGVGRFVGSGSVGIRPAHRRPGLPGRRERADHHRRRGRHCGRRRLRHRPAEHDGRFQRPDRDHHGVGAAVLSGGRVDRDQVQADGTRTRRDR